VNLRNALAAISLIATVVGVIASVNNRGVCPFAIWSGVIFVAIVIERWRYNAKPKIAQPDEVATGERFVDPETGVLMEVMYSSRTGERRYVPVSRQ
jgi:hypothetical protein